MCGIFIKQYWNVASTSGRASIGRKFFGFHSLIRPRTLHKSVICILRAYVNRKRFPRRLPISTHLQQSLRSFEFVSVILSPYKWVALITWRNAKIATFANASLANRLAPNSLIFLLSHIGFFPSLLMLSLLLPLPLLLLLLASLYSESLQRHYAAQSNQLKRQFDTINDVRAVLFDPLVSSSESPKEKYTCTARKATQSPPIYDAFHSWWTFSNGWISFGCARVRFREKSVSMRHNIRVFFVLSLFDCFLFGLYANTKWLPSKSE